MVEFCSMDREVPGILCNLQSSIQHSSQKHQAPEEVPKVERCEPCRVRCAALRPCGSDLTPRFLVQLDTASGLEIAGFVMNALPAVDTKIFWLAWVGPEEYTLSIRAAKQATATRIPADLGVLGGKRLRLTFVDN